MIAKARQVYSIKRRSFGVSILPKERKNEFAKNLEQFKAISVREKQGAKIVGDLTGKRAEVVLDPTLLLDENEWKKVEKKSRCCPKRQYVLVYALGDKNDRFEEKIKQLREKYEIFDVILGLMKVSVCVAISALRYVR